MVSAQWLSYYCQVTDSRLLLDYLLCMLTPDLWRSRSCVHVQTCVFEYWICMLAMGHLLRSSSHLARPLLHEVLRESPVLREVLHVNPVLREALHGLHEVRDTRPVLLCRLVHYSLFRLACELQFAIIQVKRITKSTHELVIITCVLEINFTHLVVTNDKQGHDHVYMMATNIDGSS